MPPAMFPHGHLPLMVLLTSRVMTSRVMTSRVMAAIGLQSRLPPIQGDQSCAGGWVSVGVSVWVCGCVYVSVRGVWLDVCVFKFFLSFLSISLVLNRHPF